MFVFLQQQAPGSIPLVFALFLAAQVPAAAAFRLQDVLGVPILLAGDRARLGLGLAALLAPLFMFYILNYVTGVPPLEEQMARGDARRAFRSRTSGFFPLPPRA